MAQSSPNQCVRMLVILSLCFLAMVLWVLCCMGHIYDVYKLDISSLLLFLLVSSTYPVSRTWASIWDGQLWSNQKFMSSIISLVWMYFLGKSMELMDPCGMYTFCNPPRCLKMLSSWMYGLFWRSFVVHPSLIIKRFCWMHLIHNFSAFCISSCFRLPKLLCFFLILSTNICT